MKKSVIVLLIFAVSMLGFSGCASSKDVNGKEVEPYGLFNEDAKKDPNVKYEVSAGSVILSIIFVETVIVPVYLIGWDLFQPVGPNQQPHQSK